MRLDLEFVTWSRRRSSRKRRPTTTRCRWKIIVRKNQLTKYTGLKYTTISKMMRYNQFPLGMFLNDAQNTRGWTLSELQEWQRKYFSEMRRRTIAAAAAREASDSRPKSKVLKEIGTASPSKAVPKVEIE